jgi:hypothetical protein
MPSEAKQSSGPRVTPYEVWIASLRSQWRMKR